MESICQQCGDKGYSNALIYCDNCDNYAVHRYCLKILPKTLDEYVIWLCEDCESKSAKVSTLDSPCPLLIKESENLENAQVNKSRPFTGLEKKSKGRKVSSHSLTDSKLLSPEHFSCHKPLESHCSGNSVKGQELRKDHGLDERISSKVAEFQSKISLPAFCDPQKLEDCVGNCDNDQKLQICNKFDEGSFLEEAESLKTEGSQIAVNDLQGLEAHLYQEGQKEQKPERWEGLDSSSFHEEAESHENKNSQLTILGLEMDCCMEREKDHKLGKYNPLHDPSFPGVASLKTEKSHPVVSDLQQLLDMDCCSGGGNNQSHGRQNVSHTDRFNEEAESNKGRNFQLAIVDSSNELGCCPYVHSQPIKDPIWSGNLNTQFGSVGGLVAHLSNIACSRAWEKAKSLPNLLLSELLPISAVWPKGFEKWGPSDDSIALYFFPDNGRDAKVFDCLIDDMICQRFSIKAVLEDAELLIFTSTILPMDYWRFQAKFYLWGVFKGKQPSCLAIDAVPFEEKEHIKTITWDAHSPMSTLRNDCNGSCSTPAPHR